MSHTKGWIEAHHERVAQCEEIAYDADAPVEARVYALIELSRLTQAGSKATAGKYLRDAQYLLRETFDLNRLHL